MKSDIDFLRCQKCPNSKIEKIQVRDNIFSYRCKECGDILIKETTDKLVCSYCEREKDIKEFYRFTFDGVSNKNVCFRCDDVITSPNLTIAKIRFAMALDSDSQPDKFYKEGILDSLNRIVKFAKDKKLIDDI